MSLSNALIREHCRGAKRHVEWARFDEESIENCPVRPLLGISGQGRHVEHWLAAVQYLLRAALLAILLAPTSPARAQVDVMLARTCVSERGWRADTDDCAAIYEVAADRVARGVSESIEGALRALSRRLHGTPCSVSRSWLCDLDEDGHRPRGMRVPWERSLGHGLGSRQAIWFFTLGEATLLVGGLSLPTREPGPVCAEPPRAWGSDEDLRRRRLAGYRWVEIDCGNTINHFGRLLRRAD